MEWCPCWLLQLQPLRRRDRLWVACLQRHPVCHSPGTSQNFRGRGTVCVLTKYYKTSYNKKKLKRSMRGNIVLLLDALNSVKVSSEDFKAYKIYIELLGFQCQLWYLSLEGLLEALVRHEAEVDVWEMGPLIMNTNQRERQCNTLVEYDRVLGSKYWKRTLAVSSVYDAVPVGQQS